MKAPGRLDPSPASPRYLARTKAKPVLYLVLAGLLVACGEHVTAPPAARAPTMPDAPIPDVIVMQRTIDIAAHDGIAAVRQISQHTLTPKLRIKDSKLSPGTGHQNAGSYPADLLLAPISLPARYETAICAELPRWTRVTPVAGAGVVTMTGVGDAPASTLRVVEMAKPLRRWNAPG